MSKKKKELLNTYLRKRKIAVDNGDKYGVSERIYLLKNKIITPEESILDFQDGLARVKYGKNKWGWIDKEGNPFPKDGRTFKIVFDFEDGLADIQYDVDKWGWIDKEGNPFPRDGKTFEFVFDFKDGLAKVRYDNGELGYIDKEGNYYDVDKKPISHE